MTRAVKRAWLSLLRLRTPTRRPTTRIRRHSVACRAGRSSQSTTTMTTVAMKSAPSVDPSNAGGTVGPVTTAAAAPPAAALGDGVAGAGVGVVVALLLGVVVAGDAAPGRGIGW